MPVAYSYLRFSSREQAKGDSIRRQTEATAKWCETNGIPLDTTLSLQDRGRSAFSRKDFDSYALAEFGRAVESGKVKPGSYLVVENLDRLSRESEVLATHRFTSILLSGVKIVQLHPEHVFTSKSDGMDIMRAVLELSRGHGESAMKSERIGAVWSKKRKEAGKRVVTSRVPTWIVKDGDKLKLDSAKAATMRKLFKLVVDGMGLTAIATKLNADGTPLMGRTSFKGEPVTWSASLVHKLVTSPAAVGHYQPHKGKPGNRQPDGATVEDYYPAVVGRDVFALAQSALRSRGATGRGRRGSGPVNLFAGLLRDARDGGALMVRHHTKRKEGGREVNREPVIVPARAVHGRGGAWCSFPFKLFEAAVLERLREVQLDDERKGKPVNRMASIQSRLGEIAALRGKWAAKMDDENLVEVVASKLAGLEKERKELAEALSAAEADDAAPFNEAAAELRTVAESLQKDGSEENRLQCRAVMRRAVEGIHCLFLDRGTCGTRTGAVQVQFKNGEHRSYLLSVRPAVRNARSYRPAEHAAKSFAETGLPELDLRKPTDAKRLEAAILRTLAKAN